MTVTATPPLKLSNLVTEFGSDGTPSLKDYVRGGARVPDIAANAAVANTTGALKLSQFYSTVAADVSMTYLGDESVTGAGGTLTAPVRTVAGLGTGVVVNVRINTSGGTDGGCSYKKNAAAYVFIDATAGWTGTFTLTNGDTLTLRGIKGTDPAPQTSSCTVVNESDGSAAIATGLFNFT